MNCQQRKNQHNHHTFDISPVQELKTLSEEMCNMIGFKL